MLLDCLIIVSRHFCHHRKVSSCPTNTFVYLSQKWKIVIEEFEKCMVNIHRKNGNWRFTEKLTRVSETDIKSYPHDSWDWKDSTFEFARFHVAKFADSYHPFVKFTSKRWDVVIWLKIGNQMAIDRLSSTRQ